MTSENSGRFCAKRVSHTLQLLIVHLSVDVLVAFHNFPMNPDFHMPMDTNHEILLMLCLKFFIYTLVCPVVSFRCPFDIDGQSRSVYTGPVRSIRCRCPFSPSQCKIADAKTLNDFACCQVWTNFNTGAQIFIVKVCVLATSRLILQIKLATLEYLEPIVGCAATKRVFQNAWGI